jgi:hypothetical protein
MEQANPDWNPHQTLEFLKVVIRTVAFELQATDKKDTNEQLSAAQVELGNLQETLVANKNDNVSAKVTANKIQILQGKIFLQNCLFTKVQCK